MINVDTGIRIKTISNQLGYYTVSLLPPGNYRIDVEGEGFRPITRSGIMLQVNHVARIDFTLEVGAVTERLEVLGAAPTVERETAALGAGIDNQKIVNLPLNGRNPYALALLAPGVLPSTVDTTRGAVRHFSATTFQVNMSSCATARNYQHHRGCQGPSREVDLVRHSIGAIAHTCDCHSSAHLIKPSLAL